MDGGVVEEDERKEGKREVCGLRHGKVCFYSVIVEAGVTDMAMIGVALRAAKGQGEDGRLFSRSRGASGWSWHIRWWTGSIRSVRCPCSVPADSGMFIDGFRRVQSTRELAMMSGR